jgi:phosphotransferase system HPr (HPr) family protein
MQRIRKQVTIKSKQGLHARPAALFVQAANKFDSHIIVEKGNDRVNGKSIMGILTLGAECGSSIIIEAEGQDAQTAILDLERLVSSNEPNART